VGAVGFQATVEDGDEPVGELTEGGLVPGAAGAECQVSVRLRVIRRIAQNAHCCRASPNGG
jgi:hypothetical protein